MLCVGGIDGERRLVEPRALKGLPQLEVGSFGGRVVGEVALVALGGGGVRRVEDVVLSGSATRRSTECHVSVCVLHVTWHALSVVLRAMR